MKRKTDKTKKVMGNNIPDFYTDKSLEELIKILKENFERRKREDLLFEAQKIIDGVLCHQIKNEQPHGMFEKRITEVFGHLFTVRTARRYMKLALRFYKSEAAAEFAALPVEEQQAQLNGEADNSVFIKAVEKFLRLD